MTKTGRLLQVLAKAEKAGGGIQSAAELAMMMQVPCDRAFMKFLSDGVINGHLRRLVRGLYESTLTPPDPETAIYKIIKKLRAGVISYISLESQLSYTGEISQVMMGRVTVVTKGRSGIFTTPYGIIELVHTKKPLAQIEPNLFFDPEIKMYRAKTEQALTDLKHCRRNLHMLV